MGLVPILNLIISASQGGPVLDSGWQSLSESAASVLINSLWQGAAVACGLALCLQLAPRIPARLRYGIWAAGFAALACLPLFSLLIERLTPATLNAASAPALGLSTASPSHPLLALDARWSLAIAALWLAASVLRAVGLAVHAVRMRRLWNSATPVSTAHAGVLGQSLHSQASALRNPAELCTTSELDRPCVIGFFRPRILIPNWLLARLTAGELEQVVLHESEHLRRKDDWANLLQKLCLVVFPLNPALWWLERRLCAEREMACDDGVIGRTQAPRAYAACLAGLAEKGLAHRNAALSLGAWQRRSELAQRVHRLLRRTPALRPAASAASVALVSCGLVAGTVALARSPRLVAFVAPASQDSNALTASAHGAESTEGDVRTDWTDGSRSFARSGAQPYRAVKALAILPTARTATLPRNNNATPLTNSAGVSIQTQQADVLDTSGRSLASLVPNAVAAQIKARQISQTAPTRTSASATRSPEADTSQIGWLVLTTYEEVQTSRSNEAMQGDAVVGEISTDSAASGPNASTSVTITRLVLRFGHTNSNRPATSNVQPDSNATPASNSSQPVAIPYRDGWLVIQL